MPYQSFCKANEDLLLRFKAKLYPTEDQKSRLLEMMTLYRYVYNWAIEVEHNNYHNDKENSHFLRNREMFDLFTKYRNDPENEWLKSLPLNTGRHAILSVIKAFISFFECRTNYPNFKSSKRSKWFYICRGDRTRIVDDNTVHLEGFVRNDNIICKKHKIPKNGKNYNVIIYFDGIDFWLTLSKEVINPIDFRVEGAITEGIGIDLGLRKLAKLSNGKEYHLPNNDKLDKRKRRQARLVERDFRLLREQESQARAKFEDVDIKPTKGMIKRLNNLRKTTRRIINRNLTYIHTMTKEIIKENPEFVVMETLNVKGMLKNKYLAKKISESNFYTISKQLEYKCKRWNIPFIKTPIGFPSTQICSSCGNRYKVGKSEIYRCPYCGLVLDRDLNAAINLKNYYYSTV